MLHCSRDSIQEEVGERRQILLAVEVFKDVPTRSRAQGPKVGL
jgi:hypothetical protein